MSKRILYIAGALAALALAGAGAACGDSDDGGGGMGGMGGSAGSGGSGGSGFEQPEGTVAVNFTVDDTANKVYAGDGTAMEWKGSFKYDTSTRIVTKDATWAGPFPPMFDDGPWNAGGHEPAGSTAGDHKLGVTVFIAPPEEGEETYEYGLNDATLSNGGGNGWIWIGSNGSFKVAAGATAAITADGLTLPKFGTNDLKLVIDTDALGAGTWDTSKVQVKGSATAWSNVELKDDGQNGDETAGDKKFTFVLGETVGKGIFLHLGLLNSGAKPEFIFSFGAGAGTEYKNASGEAEATGVTAFTKASGGTFTAATVELADNKNTFVTIP